MKTKPERLSFLSEMSPSSVSFEFFPAKTESAENKLWETIRSLEPLKPDFVSVTYGAGGSTREKTHNTVKKIKNETKLLPAAHLTCIGASKEEINEIAQQYWQDGIKHIVALRGDPPEGMKNYAPHKNGYNNATELVEGLKKLHDFEISVAAFPEGHPETGQNIDKDLDYLKAKLDAGATRAITQYFMEPEYYLNFIEKAKKHRIDIPIIPGIIVISNFEQFKKFSKNCGAKIPNWVVKLLDGLDNETALRDMVSLEISAELCKILRQEGINNFHFYTLNKSEQTKALCRILNIY